MSADVKNNGRSVAIPQPHGGALRPFKPGQSGNPAGKPKGSKHISTWIQKLLTDEEFTLDNFVGSGKKFKGAPIEAMITVGIYNSLQGDVKWAEWLAKHGYGTSLNIDVSGEVQFINDVPRPE